MGISFGLFIFSVVISIPFMISTKLKQMFDDPGEFDHIAFCVEDLPQIGQVKVITGYSFLNRLRNFLQTFT